MAIRQRSERSMATDRLARKYKETGDLNGEMIQLVENIRILIRSRIGFTHRIQRSDSADCQQDCWLEIWKSLRTWDESKGAISTMVFACVDRVVKRRSQKYMQRIERENDCGILQEVMEVRMM